MCDQVDYSSKFLHSSKFQLDYYSNTREIAFQMNLGLLTHFCNYFNHLSSICKNKLTTPPKVLLLIYDKYSCFLDVLCYHCEVFFNMPMRALLEENRLNAITMLQHGHSTVKW